MKGQTQEWKSVSRSRWSMPIIMAPLLLLMFSSVAMADVEVARQWAAAPPAIGGGASAAEWGDATVTRLAHGFMRTMNDGSFLYVLLDVVDDTTADPVPTTPDPFGGDYFVLAFDVDLNRAVTPNVDFAYSTCQDGRIFIKSFYLSASSFTGCRTVSAMSLAARGFGPTLHSATPHRFWEFRLDFDEIGVDPATWTTSAGAIQRVRVNVTTASQNPRFLTAQPDPDPYPNLTNMFQIDLATLPTFPPGSTGPIFAGV